jgi:hypothetical protein
MRRKERVEGFLEYLNGLVDGKSVRGAILEYSYLSGLATRTLEDYLEVLRAKGLVNVGYESGRSVARLLASKHPELSDR